MKVISSRPSLKSLPPFYLPGIAAITSKEGGSIVIHLAIVHTVVGNWKEGKESAIYQTTEHSPHHNQSHMRPSEHTRI